MPASAEHFTLDDLDALPDDGLKRELLDGAIVVSPSAAFAHQVLCTRLVTTLHAFAERAGLGEVLSPARVIISEDSAPEPDVAVFPQFASVGKNWRTVPRPVLVCEVVSPSSRGRDHVLKRALYTQAGIPEYWVVDPERRCVVQVRLGIPDITATDQLVWHPVGAGVPLTLDVGALFAGV